MIKPGAQRVVNMLGVLSASRRQPRRLKLCREDIIRHKTIKHAYQLFTKNEQAEQKQKLDQQYLRIKEAADLLQELDPELFAATNVPPEKKGRRFPLELRVPTDTPPRTIWSSTFANKLR
ncbi:mitochondrial 54S ribosomal protein YmL28 [Starmerella bacillaris]|uniref:Large ribosomal subunit protein mL40 n=1 Tax=Starmerella bacillaris TaxID=1247836 RepID=A0AAV5RDR3_STABA|nr:mitochondrial 54S ribosomal protein YmL28 [Starmerella bacillaris]